MPQMFDFSKFYKNKEVLTDAVIDLSGFKLKSDALAYTQNEDGTVNESNLNVHPTNNVKYYITDIYASGQKYPHGEALSFNDDLNLMVGDPLMSLVQAGVYAMPKTAECVMRIDLGAKADDKSNDNRSMYIATSYISDGSIDELYYGDESSGLGIVQSNHDAITLYVTPRVEFMCGSYITPTYIPDDELYKYKNTVSSYITGYGQNVLALLNPSVMARAYHLLGFNGDRNVTSRMLRKDLTKRRVPLDEKTFAARLHAIEERIKENGFGITVKYYDKSYDQLVYDDAGEVSDIIDVTATNITSKWTFNNLYGEPSDAVYRPIQLLKNMVRPTGKNLKDFCSYVMDEKTVEFVGDDIIRTSTEPSAAIPNIRDAFKAYYYSADELRDSFFTEAGNVAEAAKDTKDGQDVTKVIDAAIEHGDGNYVYDVIANLNIEKPEPKGLPGSIEFIKYLYDLSCYNDYASALRTWNRVLDRIKVYEEVTGSSVFTTRDIITLHIASKEGDSTKESMNPVGDENIRQWIMYTSRPARLMIPVAMTKPVRVKYKRWGRTRHKTVRKSIGIRWVEVTFIDTTVHLEYPKIDDTPKRNLLIDRDAEYSYDKTNGLYTLTFENEIEGGDGNLVSGDIVGLDNVSVTFMYKTTKFEKKMLSSVTDMAMTGEPSDDMLRIIPDTANVHVTIAYTDLQKSQKDDTRTNITLKYEMPHLPYDDELRRQALIDYGPFDQEAGALITRNGTNPVDLANTEDGWRIFYPSSKKLETLRAGLGIYDKVAMLVAILKKEFGESRVELVETRRSVDDQSFMCAGGAESTFLSWHNYGMAVKIMIYRADDPLMPIEDGSDDMLHLIDVAEAYTKCVYEGGIGTPMNVVWCGRLQVGANNFVWEFLPIGIGHKDSIMFREAMLSQRDPVASMGYIDVDAAGYVRGAPSETKPYVLPGSAAYRNAIVIGGHHFVPPESVRNYEPPSDLVLLNVLEFTNMIRAKMGAHGTTLGDTGSMFDWKVSNPESYRQLVTYFGLTGNLSGAKALLAGEYVEQYKDIFDMYYTEDPVALVQTVLGDKYDTARIYVEKDGDAGYIQLNDGKLRIKVRDMLPDNPFGQNNVFDQKQMDLTHVRYGRWDKGVFYTEAERDFGYKVSDEPVIDGYDAEGNPTRGTAYLLHSMMASQMLEEFRKIQSMFENYSGALMFDKFELGPNANDYDMLENEFGLIAAQDLIDFDKLRNMFKKDGLSSLRDGGGTGGVGNGGSGIMDDPSEDGKRLGNDLDSTTDGDSRHTEQSIYEKVVSNAQVLGIRQASLTKEHIQVNAQPEGGMTVEKLYELITKGKKLTANDIL